MNKKTLSTRAVAYVALFIAMQFVLGLASYYGPWSVVLDYLVPLSTLGIVGFIPNFKLGKTEVYTGIFVGMILKLISHLLSGAVLFASYAPKNMNPWVYSFLYNIGYNVGTLILTRREQEFPHLIGGGMNCGKHGVSFCLYYQIGV